MDDGYAPWCVDIAIIMAKIAMYTNSERAMFLKKKSLFFFCLFYQIFYQKYYKKFNEFSINFK